MKKSEYIQMSLFETTHWWFASKRRFIEVFLSFISRSNKLIILDIGAGTGANVDLLKKWGSVTALDSSPVVMNYLKTKDSTAVLGSANDLPFESSTFDLVTFLDVLYHKKVDENRALKEAIRVLKPNGYLLITDCLHQSLWSKHDEAMEAKKRFQKSELDKLISSSGFQIIRSSSIFFLTFPLFVIDRLMKKVRPSKSYVEHVQPQVNWLMIQVMKVEAFLLRYINLPIGSSAIILAVKRK